MSSRHSDGGDDGRGCGDNTEDRSSHKDASHDNGLELVVGGGGGSISDGYRKSEDGPSQNTQYDDFL
ncbi:hypothetical protein Tco_0535653 [Tanacetum coccineum]